MFLYHFQKKIKKKETNVPLSPTLKDDKKRKVHFLLLPSSSSNFMINRPIVGLKKLSLAIKGTHWSRVMLMVITFISGGVIFPDQRPKSSTILWSKQMAPVVSISKNAEKPPPPSPTVSDAIELPVLVPCARFVAFIHHGGMNKFGNLVWKFQNSESGCTGRIYTSSIFFGSRAMLSTSQSKQSFNRFPAIGNKAMSYSYLYVCSEHE
ncbi:hypothetical protein MTR67_032249 [Solanum verrucosum]|uniref:Uncharacterized protein n=1 Tax=Solanum verrucosum TaxID=315347 RepID=A0AAF0U461_SOLVR|nr:hypothetical protein MTR67_032249 [Solanum verrucosum]